MKKDIYFTPDNITVANLKRLSDIDSANTELRMMELSDVASSLKDSIDAMLDLEFGLFDILSLISERLAVLRSSDVSGESDGFLGACLKIRDNGDKVLLSSLIAEYIEKLGYSDGDFLMAEEMGGLFTYVKNVFADEAFDVFSQDFGDARVRYSRDFSECVKLLLSGEVSFCLLPFEERGGIRLPTVEELIFRNDLKVCSVTPVFGPDGMQDLKYALVSDRFASFDYSPGDDRYIEIRIPDTASVSLSDILSSAGMIGHSTYRVNTLSISGEGSLKQFFSIVLRADGRSFTSLLTYLTLFTTDYLIVGIYKNLE